MHKKTPHIHNVMMGGGMGKTSSVGQKVIKKHKAAYKPRKNSPMKTKRGGYC